ncbi:MAG: hypothetical protein DDT22_01072 [candidate division WS2 bacterium]|nr:hypothetical protein [Candidatus Lithacetigena glycinireducens]
MVNTGLTNNIIYSLTVDPVNPSILYACTQGGGIFKSTNRGENWSTINSGLIGLSSKVLAIDQSNNHILYAGVSSAGRFDGVYQSLKGGSNWNNFNSGLPQNTDSRQITDVICISIDPINSKNVYVGLLYYGVYKYSINNPPSFRNLPASKSIISGKPFTYQVEASDPEGEVLTFSVEGAPLGINISSTGLISWPNPKTGSYSIIVRISDGTNSPITSTLFLKVTTTLIFTIDKKDYLINDLRQTMDVVPIIREARVLLPVRFVAEPLGATVLWDGATRKVIIILEKQP